MIGAETSKRAEHKHTINDEIESHHRRATEDYIHSKPTKPITLQCQFNVLGLSNIDSVQQSFDLEMIAEAFLDLSRSNFYPGDQGREEIGFAFHGISVPELLQDPSIWSPKLSLKNVKHHLEPVEKWFTVNSSKTGIYYKYKFKSCMVTQLELRHFPFDKQALHVLVSSDYPLVHDPKRMAKEGGGSVLLVPRQNKSYLQRLQRDALDCWSMHDEVIYSYVGSTYASFSTSHQTYPLIQFTLFLRRKPWYYIWNIVLPMFLLASMSGTVRKT
jgi:hypothetical protein